MSSLDNSRKAKKSETRVLSVKCEENLGGVRQSQAKSKGVAVVWWELGRKL